MEIIFRSVSPGVHSYSPFAKSSSKDSSLNLQELCKNVILKHITLRRLAISATKLPLPKLLRQYIAELTTTDFELIECAPFSDAFSCNFFYRALTYKVFCLRDEQQYMITYGYNPVGDVKQKVDHEQWVKIQHKNIMSVCATVKDHVTKNVFYVYDQPYASLETMWKIFCEKNPPVPDAFFVRLATDLCEALGYIRANGLRYNRFGLANIFIMNDRLVFENGLMLKSMKFITDRRNGYGTDERSILRDITTILKLLLQSFDNSSSHSKTLPKLIYEIESQKCIGNLLQMLNRSQGNEGSFSYGKLIQNLQN